MTGPEGQNRERPIIAHGVMAAQKSVEETMCYLYDLRGCFNAERKPSAPKDYSN